MHAADGTNTPSVALAVHHLSKTFPGTRALADVSLTVGTGHVHALIGNNGSGKSTLVKILAGVHQGDRDGRSDRGDRDDGAGRLGGVAGSGRIVVGGAEIAADATSAAWARGVGLRFVHQEPGTFPGLTVAENLALGGRFPRRRWGAVDRRALRARAGSVLERFGIAARPDDDVRTLPPAERVLLAIGRALQDDDESRVLILDEPTALLPAHRAAAVWSGIRRVVGLGHSVVLVSHRLDEVVAHADAVTVLRDGRAVAHLMRPDLTEARLAGAMTGSAGEAPSRAAARAPGPRRFATEPALVVEDLRGGKVQAATFTVGHGEIVGVTGPLGGGQSDLLQLLFGARAVADGRVTLLGRDGRFHDIGEATRAGVAYVPADRSVAVFPELPLYENVTAGALSSFGTRLLVRRSRELEFTRAWMEKLAIRAASPRQPMATVSGGNQQKAVLARWLSRRPSLLLLDEPTQGVDVSARAEIHSIIRTSAAEGCAVVVASGDFRELAALCDRVLVMAGGRVVDDVGGDTTPDRLAALVLATHDA